MIVIGERFGRLVVLRRLDNNQWKEARVECICDCGTVKSFTLKVLRRGDTKSCCCLKNEASSRRLRTHGKTGTRTYSCYKNILTRCFSVKGKSFSYYGAKGITICDRWLKFENFLADMGECPDGLTIERLRNDLGYSRRNCEWASRLTQGRNRASVRKIHHNGEVKTCREWAEFLGIKGHTLYMRLHRNGWNMGRCL